MTFIESKANQSLSSLVSFLSSPSSRLPFLVSFLVGYSLFQELSLMRTQMSWRILLPLTSYPSWRLLFFKDPRSVLPSWYRFLWSRISWILVLFSLNRSFFLVLSPEEMLTEGGDDWKQLTRDWMRTRRRSRSLKNKDISFSQRVINHFVGRKIWQGDWRLMPCIPSSFCSWLSFRSPFSFESCVMSASDVFFPLELIACQEIKYHHHPTDGGWCCELRLPHPVCLCSYFSFEASSIIHRMSWLSFPLTLLRFFTVFQLMSRVSESEGWETYEEWEWMNQSFEERRAKWRTKHQEERERYQLISNNFLQGLTRREGILIEYLTGIVESILELVFLSQQHLSSNEWEITGQTSNVFERRGEEEGGEEEGKRRGEKKKKRREDRKSWDRVKESLEVKEEADDEGRFPSSSSSSSQVIESNTHSHHDSFEFLTMPISCHESVCCEYSSFSSRFDDDGEWSVDKINVSLHSFLK